MEIRVFGLQYGLQPVQVEALTYLTQCNRYSDTPQAVTEFLGLTKGTVSQSLKVLEQKGFLRKQQDTHDKRIIRLAPTAKGRKLIEQSISAKGLESALANTHSLQVGELGEVLRSILRDMQHIHNRKTFAACHTCHFNETHEKGFVCGLTNEPLSASDVNLICREHQFPQ
jgi:DNA-binding MarR family transcriptional regulator